MKRFCGILALILLLSLLLPCVSAAEETLPFTYEIKDGEVTLTSYTGPDSGSVVVPDEIEGLPVTAFGDHLFANKRELQFNLPKHLKRLESYALAGLERELYIPATVTDIAPDSLPYNGTLSCEKYSAADQYARAFGRPVQYTGEVPGVQEVEADGFTFWIQNGEATLAHVISEEKFVLNVPAYVGDYPVTRIATYATPERVDSYYTQNIFTALVIPATVRRVDSYAFYNQGRGGLRSVFLCEGVASVGDYAFYDSCLQIGNSVSLTLPNSLQEFGRTEKELWNSRLIYLYAAEGSAGAEYAQRAGATFIKNHAEDGTITGNYANMKFRIQNGEAAIYDDGQGGGYFDPFLPSYIDTYPLTRIESGALWMVGEDYAVLPPTLTYLGSDCFGDVSSEARLLLYYPGTPAEELVKHQRFPYANIYDILALPYDDVAGDSWYYSAVSFAYYNGLMNGVAAEKFDPNGTMTRAMLVTVLWRLDGGEAAGTSPFTDVPENQWYTEGVIWAAENGIVNGVGGGRFDPNGSVTREQIATILYRYAEYCGLDVSERAALSRFADAARVSDYAAAPMQWAVQLGIIGGRQESSGLWLAPQSSGTRAEVAAMLMRFLTRH